MSCDRNRALYAPTKLPPLPSDRLYDSIRSLVSFCNERAYSSSICARFLKNMLVSYDSSNKRFKISIPPRRTGENEAHHGLLYSLPLTALFCPLAEGSHSLNHIEPLKCLLRIRQGRLAVVAVAARMELTVQAGSAVGPGTARPY